jgi:murein DD-endopeptidase MepM/ murein hydrolase activator NlpD
VKIPLIADQLESIRSASLSRWTRALLSFCVIGLPLGTGLATGYVLGHHQPSSAEEGADGALHADVTADKPEAQHLHVLAERMSELEARVEHLSEITDGDGVITEVGSKSSNSASTGIGGPSDSEIVPPQSDDIYVAIDRLSRQVDEREQQLNTLEEMLINRKVGDQAIFGAQPAYRAEVSSYFGMRFDPISGRRSMHDGIDFSGKSGSAILSAGDGVVTFAGEKQGYGRLIEVNHGDDCFTRYAHSKLIFVKQGDVVKKGQVIALMGSSGRATGTHLHFEVYKHGRPVDPFIYIQQASR